jgi:prepilin-type N-terminal cleavage/methylation domain-containing protein
MKKRAFTLIELLVVIAIIAILAAILFPVFAQAKAAAKKVQSLSNTKNIGLGFKLYEADVDDMLPTLQDQPLGGTWIGWPQKLYPYIKNGTGLNGSNGTIFGASGIFRAPGDPTKAENGSYQIHQDLARDGQAPWNGYAKPTVFSETQIEGVADKVYLIEHGINKGYASWLQFTPWEWDWVDWINFNRTTGQAGPGAPNNYVSLQAGVGDCDFTYSATDFDSFNTWALCGMHPRYRYTNATPTVFLDGHAKTFSRSAKATSLDWFKYIYVKEASQYDASWYPY